MSSQSSPDRNSPRTPSGPLVSVISPVYNMALYLPLFLDSILAQTYPFIELILIDDGSTDNSPGVIRSYRERFRRRGIAVHYLSQENQGVSAAINHGLRVMTGDFFIWPDSDDTLEPDSIARRVDVLLNQADCDTVLSQAYITALDSAQVDKIWKIRDETAALSNLFEALMFGISMSIVTSTYMIRTSSFRKFVPAGQIYPSRRGQNWQLLLPILYQGRAYYLREPLSTYWRRRSGMQHSAASFDDQTAQLDADYDILKHVLVELNVLGRYEKKLRIHYLKKRVSLAFQHGRHADFKAYFSELCTETKVTFKERLKSLIISNQLAFSLYRLIKGPPSQ